MDEVVTDDEIDGEDAEPTIARSPKVTDFLEMRTRLRAALGDARGKIRVSDIHVIAGLERQSPYLMGLIARALRHLGWERARFRFDGVVRYAYAKGTRLQRENILEIDRTGDGKLVVKKRNP